MAATVEDLWSDDIKLEVHSPLAILRFQEAGIARRTAGALRAKVDSVVADREVRLTLDLIAPSLNSYTVRLLTATHAKDMPYPVVLTADAFFPEDRFIPLVNPVARALGKLDENQRRAASDEEFIDLVRQVLRSPKVRALIHSLIARINDSKPASPPNGSDHAEDDA